MAQKNYVLAIWWSIRDDMFVASTSTFELRYQDLLEDYRFKANSNNAAIAKVHSGQIKEAISSRNSCDIPNFFVLYRGVRKVEIVATWIPSDLVNILRTIDRENPPG